MSMPHAIPVTVIGGYLGAGKTTLLNALLADPGGRRLGVIVNDFGELAIDVERLRAAAGDGGERDLVSLPNGCVCCTLGADLQGALRSLAERTVPPDQIVVEVSGVADPAATAAWGTVPPFAPGGVIVLADASAVRRHAANRYVGGEVSRQLAGADLVLLTKRDLVGDDERRAVEGWLGTVAPSVPLVQAVAGDVPADVVLGLRPAVVRHDEAPGGDAHDERYASWSWSAGQPLDLHAVERFVAELPAGVLRLKGQVAISDGSVVGVDVVGARRSVTAATGGPSSESHLVAIGLRDLLDPDVLDAHAGVMHGR
jgi:G3E family GTPase